MPTTSTSIPGPQLDLTRLPAANSQRPAHISRSAFLTRPPQPPTDAFGAGTGSSEFPNTSSLATDAFDAGTDSSEFPNTSSLTTAVSSKRVRAASEETSSGTKRARLDDGTSNSINGSTRTQSHPKDGSTPTQSPPKEKKIPQFAVGYVSGVKPKAADYEDVVQALLLRAMHEYESRIVGVNPYPDSANQSKWTKICWKEACHVAAEDYSMTERMSKIVCI
jgi:hypothetical protein